MHEKIAVDELLNEGEYEVKVLSNMQYVLLPDGLPEFAIAVQIKVDGRLYIYPLVLGLDVERVPNINEVVWAKYYKNFYNNRYYRWYDCRDNEERFVLVHEPVS